MSNPIPTPTLSLMRGGFQMQDLRGYTLSIGLGDYHYCDNHDPAGADEDLDLPLTNSIGRQLGGGIKPTPTMEVAVMHTDGGGFVPIGECDDVAGYVPVTELSGLIEAVWEHDWDRVRSICNTEDN